MIALRFLILGALLFAADRQAREWGWIDKPTIVVATAAEVEDEVLYREALRRGLDRNPSVRKRLVELVKSLEPPSTRDDPALDDARHRRALALGLDRTDLAIRRHLVLQMRLLASLPPGEKPIGDADLADLMERRPGLFERPARARLSHLFFSKRVRGAQAYRDAVARDGAGDPFAAGRDFTSDVRDLAEMFGAPIADRISTIPEGEWSEPLESIYGWHVVKVNERLPPALPSIAQARPRLVETLRGERAAARYAAYYPQLLARYDVRIEEASR